MKLNLRKLFFVGVAFGCLISGQGVVLAQTLQDQMDSMVDRALETATYENGVLKSARLQIPFDTERLFTFDSSPDGKSLTITDDSGVSVQIIQDSGSRISALVLPQGVLASFKWNQSTSGGDFIEEISVKPDSYSSGYSLFEIEAGPDCYEASERAAAASVIAFGVCAVSPGSTACWAATATAAYLTYRAWVACNQ